MIKKKRRLSVPGIVLIVLSIAMIVPALVLLHSVSNDFQYILPGAANGQELRALYQEGKKTLEALSGWTDQVSILGKAQGVALSTDFSSASMPSLLPMISSQRDRMKSLLKPRGLSSSA